MRKTLMMSVGLAALAAPGWADLPSSAQRESKDVPGLEAPAEIIVDQWGVPHIYAGSTRDALFVQGYNAARDRLWQIDLWRKRGLGRLSESFGEKFVDQDRAARMFLYRGDMEAEWAAYGPNGKPYATAFVEGVNAYVQQVLDGSQPLPVEFSVTGSKPELWELEDVVRIRSHSLTRNAPSEVARAQITCGKGIEADRLRQTLEPDWTPTVPEGLDPCTIPDDVLDDYELATQNVKFEAPKKDAASAPATDPAATGTTTPPADAAPSTSPAPAGGGAAAPSTSPAPAEGTPASSGTTGDKRSSLDPAAFIRSASNDAQEIGSNHWVISGSRTDTGRPILASDPHRAHSVPSLRYVVHLNAPDMSVIGAGEPALPGISIGHNGTVGFGLTIFGSDQEDVYQYELNPDNPNQYRYNGEWVDMEVVEDTVAVRDGEAKPITMKFTRHGPVLKVDEDQDRAWALRSVWFEPGTAAYFGSVDYMGAKNWDEFTAALERFSTPSENQAYADTEGNIGWVVGTMSPLRQNWDGLLPVPGDGRYEWEFLPRDQLPREFNPASGYYANGNEMNLPADYPYRENKVGFEWTNASRFDRLVEVLSANDKSTLADSMALQNDNNSFLQRRMIALFKNLTLPEGASQADRDGLALLQGWDGVTGPDSAAAALGETLISKHLVDPVAKRVLGDDLAELLGKSAIPSVVAFLEAPDAQLGDDPQGARDEILRESLSGAVAEVTEALGPDMATWRWGDLHRGMFKSPVSPLARKGLADKLNVGPVATGGSTYSPNMAGYNDAFDVTTGASFRMVLDVGNWDASRFINTPGQSGDPSSPHYRDLAPLWATGTYAPLVYSREAVEAAATRVISLTPGN